MAIGRIPSIVAELGSVNSGAFQIPQALGFTKLSLLVDYTAESGTDPTLDVDVEWSEDGTTFVPAETADAFTQFAAVGAAVKQFDIKGQFYRVVYVVGGTATPTVTFSIDDHLV